MDQTNVWKETALLRFFGWAKIPLLAYVRPIVEELSETKVIVRIPLRRRTKNHLGSMYFGALSVGADVAGGLLAMRLIQQSGQKISLVFKSFNAEFLRRPEEDVRFVCEDGPAIRDLVEQAKASNERVECPVHIRAVTESSGDDRPVAKFVLLLSLRKSR